jgi:hypothetical protein
MNGIPYKDGSGRATFAAKGSQLYAALTEGPEKDRAKNAKAVYDATTERMNALTKTKETK